MEFGRIYNENCVETLSRMPDEMLDMTAAPCRTSEKIKDLVLVMADPALQESVECIIAVNKEVPLWKEGRLVLQTKYLEGDLVGEKYRLTNVPPSDMLLVEQELYRRGVCAVSIEHHTLPAGDGTDIFLVRERKENE